MVFANSSNSESKTEVISHRTVFIVVALEA
jgi:hypothetical protein